MEMMTNILNIEEDSDISSWKGDFNYKNDFNDEYSNISNTMKKCTYSKSVVIL